jgi:hypothetical protein
MLMSSKLERMVPSMVQSLHLLKITVEIHRNLNKDSEFLRQDLKCIHPKYKLIANEPNESI